MAAKCDYYYEMLWRSDYHIHTSYTDGKNSVYEYCQKAKENGLKLIVFSEHVRKTLSYDYGDLLAEIDRARSKFKELKILSGCEAKVLNVDGELDVSDSVLDSCDLVTGVFHGFMYRDKTNYLHALKSMLRRSTIDIWGHPTIFAKKNGIQLDETDIEDIIITCADNNVLVEINMKYKLPNEDFLRTALSNDVKFVVGSDAHNVDELLTIQKLKEVSHWVNKVY